MSLSKKFLHAASMKAASVWMTGSSRAWNNRTFMASRNFRKEEKSDEMKLPFDPKSVEAFSPITGEPGQKVKELAEQVMALNMIEVTELVTLLKKRLGLPDAMNFQMMGGMPGMMQQMQSGAGGAASASAASPGADAAPAAKVEAKKEKTEFTLKLESFNAADKLKIIKEIRAITGLGLKESKDLVEGAPKDVKEGISKEDAEKFKAQIESAGGKVSIS